MQILLIPSKFPSGFPDLGKFNLVLFPTLERMPLDNVANPTNAQDVATKSYVDGVLTDIPEQGGLGMGSFTNQPGL